MAVGGKFSLASVAVVVVVVVVGASLAVELLEAIAVAEDELGRVRMGQFLMFESVVAT